MTSLPLHPPPVRFIYLRERERERERKRERERERERDLLVVASPLAAPIELPQPRIAADSRAEGIPPRLWRRTAPDIAPARLGALSGLSPFWRLLALPSLPLSLSVSFWRAPTPTQPTLFLPLSLSLSLFLSFSLSPFLPLSTMGGLVG